MGQLDQSPEKISEAINLLEQVANSKRKDVKDVVEQRVDDLKAALTEIDPKLSEIKSKVKSSFEDMKEGCRETAVQADKTVRRNPWQFIGGALLTGALVGFFATRK